MPSVCVLLFISTTMSSLVVFSLVLQIKKNSQSLLKVFITWLRINGLAVVAAVVIVYFQIQNTHISCFPARPQGIFPFL